MSDQTPPPPPGDDTAVEHFDIEPIQLQDEMENSFLEYAMSVIMQRALPDARDGLKPVHRRILWGMEDIGARPDRSHMKCARITGHVMGHFHPHGDSAIYDALVRMAQPFSLRHPLVDFHGNYGSPDFGPAAARYTECRLSNLAMRLLDGINEETVDFNDTYSGEFTEPSVLPARFPNLLVNGSEGIAVGMATKIPPHNLGEVIDATVHLLENPEAQVEDLMKFVKAPDFPTGALLMGRQGVIDAYTTGKGTVKLRARAEIVEGRQRDMIVVTEMPYQTSISATAAKIKELVNDKVVEGIADVNDASAKGETKLEITLKRDAPGLVVLNNLYKHTPLQTSYSINMVALVDGVPRTLNLLQALQSYVGHQIEVITRRSEFRLRKARDRAHIVEGLIKALDLIDEIIAAIRASADKPAAREALDLRALRVLRRPGRAHPRHAAVPPDPARPRAARVRAGRAARDHRRARVDPGRRRQAPAGHQGRAGADPRRLRHRPPLRDHARPWRHRHRGPHRRRGARRHALAPGLHQDRRGRQLPPPGARRAGRGRRQAARRGLRHQDPDDHRARLPAVLLEPRQGVPPQGPRDPEEGPHRAAAPPS